jgi:hypothetical protein
MPPSLLAVDDGWSRSAIMSTGENPRIVALAESVSARFGAHPAGAYVKPETPEETCDAHRFLQPGVEDENPKDRSTRLGSLSR